MCVCVHTMEVEGDQKNSNGYQHSSEKSQQKEVIQVWNNMIMSKWHNHLHLSVLGELYLLTVDIWLMQSGCAYDQRL